MFNKIKQGGVLGRNLKHAQTIKKRGMLLLTAIFLMFTVTIVDAGINHISGKGILGATAMTAALPVFLVDGKFKELKGADLEAFTKDATPEDFADYYSALNEHRNKELKALIEAKASKEDIDNALKEIKESQLEEMKTLNKTIKEYGLAITKLSKNNGGGSNNEASVMSQLVANKDALLALMDKSGNGVKMTVKAAGTMTTSNVTAVGTNGLSMLLNQFEPGITPIPRSQPFFADLFAQVPTTGSTVSYAEMKNPDGGAGMTAEGSAKSQADFDLIEAKATVRKITAYIKTSKEALADIPALAGEINGELMTLINLKKDSQVLSGDNSSNNLNGVLEIAQDFTGDDLAGTILSPNNYDVLVAAITEIMVAEVVSGEPAGFLANVIVLNPIDVAKMKLTKDANENYIFPVTLPGATSVMEVPVISNARMTKGDFLVMDSTKGNLRIREGVTLDVGYENADFTLNLVTILAEMRLCFYVKSQHVKAFITGDFESAKTLLKLV